MRVISEEVNGGDIGHVQDALRFHRVRWIFRLVHEFDDSEVILVTSFSLLSYPFWICSKSNGYSTGCILTGLDPIRISVLITSWIISVLILRDRVVQEMMEDQVMISICMVMKGMRNGL